MLLLFNFVTCTVVLVAIEKMFKILILFQCHFNFICAKIDFMNNMKIIFFVLKCKKRRANTNEHECGSMRIRIHSPGVKMHVLPK